MNNDETIIVFGDKRPDSLFIEDIFDPDVPTSGSIKPHPGSLAVEKGTGLLYYVYSVDPITFKSTLKPCRFISIEDIDGDGIPDDLNVKRLDYGNDRLMLYWDDRTNPIKLQIDSKLVVFGTPNIEYRLMRYNENKEQEIISLYLDSDEKFVGNRIPMAKADGLVGAKSCTNCHTLYPMKDGDVVYLEVFNTIGMLAARFTLFTQRATLLNDLASDANPIMKFDATCLQMRGDEWYIYEKQEPTSLGIAPYIEHADSSRQEIVVDNNKCVIYGLDDFIPSYPGYRHHILIKYFLNGFQQSPYSVLSGRHRFLTVEKFITVLQNNSEYSVKISVIPVWNNASMQYDLKFFAYSNRRDTVFDVTSFVEIETDYQGNLFYKEQKVTFNLDLSKVFSSSMTVIHRQDVWVSLFPVSQFQKYILKDSKDAEVVYGVEAGSIKRPVIHYDKDLKQYFIPTSVFRTKESFLDSFFKNASPPYNTSSETVVPTPTHFTIRALDNCSTLVMLPIEVDQFEQAWNIVRQGAQDQLVGSTVLVEFLYKVGDQYTILYGVPVDVHLSLTGYNNP